MTERRNNPTEQHPRSRRFGWKGFHKWGGLVMSVFLLVFCVSGIILNHRHGVAGIDVSRRLLPASYSIKDYNNGVLKGTIPYADGRVLIYGNAGMWLADSDLTHVEEFNSGLPSGVDSRNVRHVLRTTDGRYWCATQFGLYRLDGTQWVEVELPGNSERVSDIALTPDSTDVVALTRSNIYTRGASGFEARTLTSPAGYESRTTLFKTLWQLHSGELFGMAGRVIVDLIAIILIFICISGIVVFVLPYPLRRMATARVRKCADVLKWNVRWHDRIGYWTLVLTLLIVLTGTCLRPPLMIPCVLVQTAPVPGTAAAGPNAWHDKLRALRWDASADEWLISTSEGFLRADAAFAAAPRLIPAGEQPSVSPMGVNVFENIAPGQWLIGSFSGLYVWNSTNGEVTDWFSGNHPSAGGGRPVSNHLIAGYTADFGTPAPVEYSVGTASLPSMPAALADAPMSLWNFALELHVGRCYTPFLGPLSGLFIFLSGTIIIIVLVSGLIIHRRHARRRRPAKSEGKNNIK